MPGFVYLVGAGPGDPDLLTLRGAACLRRADLVLYDYLVNPVLLRHARPGAECVALGRHGRGRALSPEEITERMLEAAAAGRVVVRLKGGDPSMFGRLADETDALRAAGIRFEVVPGITAALAAAAYCELPLTQHEEASAVAFIAGRERHGKDHSTLDYGTLATFPGTLVLYMGVGTAGEWSRALMERGKPGDTAVAVVACCTRARHRVVRTSLARLEAVIARDRIKPPALCIVGPIAEHAPDHPWFTSRLLFGQRIVVIGPRRQAARLGRALTELGAELAADPATQRVGDPVLEDALGSGEVDCVLLSGSVSARRFLQRYRGELEDTRLLALGTGAAAVLQAEHRPVETVSALDPAAIAAAILQGEGVLAPV